MLFFQRKCNKHNGSALANFINCWKLECQNATKVKIQTISQKQSTTKKRLGCQWQWEVWPLCNVQLNKMAQCCTVSGKAFDKRSNNNKKPWCWLTMSGNCACSVWETFLIASNFQWCNEHDTMTHSKTKHFANENKKAMAKCSAKMCMLKQMMHQSVTPTACSPWQMHHFVWLNCSEKILAKSQMGMGIKNPQLQRQCNGGQVWACLMLCLRPMPHLKPKPKFGFLFVAFSGCVNWNKPVSKTKPWISMPDLKLSRLRNWKLTIFHFWKFLKTKAKLWAAMLSKNSFFKQQFEPQIKHYSSWVGK